MDGKLIDPDHEPTPEEVQLGVLERIEYVVQNELRELDQANKDRPLNAVAWISRNLLELVIWTVYCIESPANAKVFADDAARDALDMLKNIPQGKFSNDPNYSFQGTRDDLLKHAKNAGVLDLEKKHQQTNVIAEKVGSTEEFRVSNKVLSKFAHPTALWIMTEQEELEHFRPKIYEGGVNYAAEALRYISHFREQQKNSQ